MTNLNKLTMTLALLIMVAAGAWAKTYTTLKMGDVIKLGDVIAPEQAYSVNSEAFIFYAEGNPYTLVRVNTGQTTTEDANGAYYAFRRGDSTTDFNGLFAVTGTTDGLVVTGKDGNYITIDVHNTYDPVLQEDGTWQFTMPAYNMLLEAEMKDESQTTVTYDGVTPGTNDWVKAYMGFEEYFASKLAATVRNLTQDEPVQSPTFTYKTSNPAVIAFDNGTQYPQGAGTLAQMRFYGTGDAELTVQYTGTGDISRSEATLHVKVAEPATLTLVADPTTGGTVEVVMPESELKVKEITSDMVAGWSQSTDPLTADDLPDFQAVTEEVANGWTGAPNIGDARLYYALDDDKAYYAYFYSGTNNSEYNNFVYNKGNVFESIINECEIKSYYSTVSPVNIVNNGNGKYSVIPGTSVSLKATAAKGYQLNSWSDNATADADDNTVATITVDATATATAYFVEKEYEVDLTVNGDDAQGTEKAKWTGKVGEQGTAKNFPITAKIGQAVTLNYSGHLKVKAVTATTDAANPNAYLMWDATKKKLVEEEIPANAKKVENADDRVEWAAGTYLVEGNVTINGTVSLAGDVELIIKDGAKLTAKYIDGDYNNLNIYGQANKSGELNVACYDNDAIKSFNQLNIHSCKVNASSSYNACGGFNDIDEFNLYGGSVDAKNTGGPDGYGLCEIPSLNIWGGEMKAEGKGNGIYSYGITYDFFGTNVTVYGGKLWVKADENALDPNDRLTFKKDDSYTDGKIQTSNDGVYWDEYTESDKPDTKYVRVGY